MSRHSRRSFLKKTTLAGLGATIAIPGVKAFGRIRGANDRIRVAVAGIHGRGRAHVAGFGDLDGVEVAALVDPDSRLFEPLVKQIQEESKAHNTPRCFQDIRKVLDDPTIDVVSIATPNHWHALMTIWACQAGKHVYVEKPASHNVFEGRVAVAAARKYKRLVQHGTQSRSSQARTNQIAAIHSGKYGKLRVAKAYACKPRWTIGTQPTTEPPKELDFDLWLGPATQQPFHQNLVHYNWHWFWDTGNGEIGNQGVHQMDIARWGIKDGTLPERVWSLGGRWVNEPGYQDQGQTPNMQMAVLEFGDVLLVFETRGLVEKKASFSKKVFPSRVNNEFYTTDGRVDCDTNRFYPNGGGKPEKIVYEGPCVTPGGPFGSFVDVLRSEDYSRCNGDILEGHLSAACCHLANISYRLGQDFLFRCDPCHLGSNRQVLDSLDMIRENLAGSGFKLDDATYRVGPVLWFDAQCERFMCSRAANAMLSRCYRPPFIVPRCV